MAEFEIRLENVRMYAHHGVFEHERRDGNEFEINLSVRYRTSESPNGNTDDISDTVSYADLWDIVKEEMAMPRNLLETVVKSIVERVENSFPYLDSIECKLSKLSPPIPGFSGSASVAYRLNRK